MKDESYLALLRSSCCLFSKLFFLLEIVKRDVSVSEDDKLSNVEVRSSASYFLHLTLHSPGPAGPRGEVLQRGQQLPSVPVVRQDQAQSVRDLQLQVRLIFINW